MCYNDIRSKYQKVLFAIYLLINERGNFMSKLYFRYGCMGSSKTAEALMVKYNYEERGQKAVIAKPSVDTRDGTFTIKSRIGLSTEGITVEKLLAENTSNYDAIIIDEAQFMTPEQVDALAEIADNGTPVICYGLRTDFQGKFFPGSLRLMEVADTIE